VRIVTLPGFVAWDRLGIAVEHFVEYNGIPVLSVKKAFRKAAKLCEPDLSEGNITPHTMRDTAAAWLMQAGADLWVAAGYLGMTVETLKRTYGYHPPDFLAEAVGGSRRGRRRRRLWPLSREPFCGTYCGA